MNIGSRIKEQRQVNKINQEALANKLNMSRANIGHMETGKSKPTLESIEIMCQLFNVSADYLIFGQEVNQEISENKDEKQLLEIYKQLNQEYKTICKYKAKELLKEQKQEEEQQKSNYNKVGNL